MFCKSYNLSFDPRNTGDTSRKLMHESQNFYDEIKGKQKICLWLCGPVSLQYRVAETEALPQNQMEGENQLSKSCSLTARSTEQHMYTFTYTQ